MQVFCIPQVERCFAVPAARRIYATADRLAVAEIDQLPSSRRGCHAVFTMTNQWREFGKKGTEWLQQRDLAQPPWHLGLDNWNLENCWSS